MTIETRRRAPTEREQSPVRDVIMDDGLTNQTTTSDAQGARGGLYGDNLLTVRLAAKALGISERLLWSQTNCGNVPHLRIGRRVLYDPADLRGWIARQKQRARR